jgi:drug/metabolite transporter (DMT)-like permease
MKLRDAAEWVLLGAIWGAAFLFTKVAVPEFGPFALVEVRLAVAALVLAVPVALRNEWVHIRRRWLTLLVLGAVNTAVPFTLFAWAMRPMRAADGTEQSLSAGDASVLNATAALFAAAIGGLMFRERLSVRRGVGLAVGFVGVVLLVWEKLSFRGSEWATAAALSAAFLYGVASHVINRKLKGVPPAAISAGSLAFSALMLLPLAAMNLPTTVPTVNAWMAAGTLAVLCTAVAFLMYFRLLRTIGPTRGITVSYAIPAFGILWGWLWLGEHVSASTIVGGVVIVAGTVLVQWPERKKEETAPRQQDSEPVTTTGEAHVELAR